MELKRLFLRFACVLAIGAGFVSCSDDDNNIISNNDSDDVLPEVRAFILNMGSYGYNNTTLTFYDPAGQVDLIGDLYYLKNGRQLGDTGQDIIEYDGNLYITMYGSNYIVKLDGEGVEQCRYEFTESQGQPRYMAAADDKIYVTLYSGNVARFDAEDLAFEAMVEVGDNPECIVEEDGKLYCVNSGWGADNRLSIIDISTFSQAENVEIFQNPDKIIECDGHIYIQGYGSDDYLNYPYPVAEFDPVTKTYQEIGRGTHIAAFGNTLYVIDSNTDWTTYETTNTFYSYNADTGVVNNSTFLQNMPDVLTSASIYMFNINEDTGEFYIGVTYYSQGNSDIYRFAADGTFMEQFESGGQSAYKMIFVN